MSLELDSINGRVLAMSVCGGTVAATEEAVSMYWPPASGGAAASDCLLDALKVHGLRITLLGQFMVSRNACRSSRSIHTWNAFDFVDLVFASKHEIM